MKQWAIGVDLGGTKIEVALVNSEGNICDRIRIPTEAHLGQETLIQNIIITLEKLQELHKEITVSAIGIGLAGQIHKDSDIVEYAPNLGWHHVDLRGPLKDKFNLPVAIYNDVRAATYGEWKYGAGKGCQDIVCVFVGTGIGGGIVSNDKLLIGSNNTAGEIGHMTIDLHGPACHCGNKGCFEALVSGWAIERDLKAAVGKDKKAGKLLLELAGGNIDAISAKIFADALHKEDPLSKEIYMQLVEALIAGSTSIVNVFGPSKLIYGGGIIEGMPELIGHVENGLKKYALKAAMESLQVVPASLHNDSGVVGAAALVLNKKFNE